MAPTLPRRRSRHGSVRAADHDPLRRSQSARNELQIGKMTDADREVEAFLNQIDVAIRQMQLRRYLREFPHESCDHRCTCRCPNRSGAATDNRPRGADVSPCADSSASSRSDNMRRARSRNRPPASLRLAARGRPLEQPHAQALLDTRNLACCHRGAMPRRRAARANPLASQTRCCPVARLSAEWEQRNAFGACTDCLQTPHSAST